LGYLIDTNVVSELAKGARRDQRVADWFASVEPGSTSLSVLVLGEIRRGIESLRGRDPSRASTLEDWLRSVEVSYAGRVLVVSRDVADRWGRLTAMLGTASRMPEPDGLLAATALVHGLTLVTRNTKDLARAGVALRNPFEPGS
jgi:toxin FitB